VAGDSTVLGMLAAFWRSVEYCLFCKALLQKRPIFFSIEIVLCILLHANEPLSEVWVMAVLYVCDMTRVCVCHDLFIYET